MRNKILLAAYLELMRGWLKIKRGWPKFKRCGIAGSSMCFSLGHSLFAKTYAQRRIY